MSYTREDAFRRSILSLIPKGTKNHKYLKNWRPVSLLCSHYKLFTKILANRLSPVLDEIISVHQNAYIKGRQISNSLRTIQDVIENFEDNIGIIAILDFEKAFDVVNWDFLRNSLKFMNFGENMINSIFTCYNDIETSILINGEITEFFKPSNGLRQGCPLSGLLFLIISEVLSQEILENDKISGLKFGKFEIKIDQFADDTRLFLKDIKSLKEALNILKHFEKVSGLSVNIEKSEAFWLGNNIVNSNPCGLKWTKDPVKSLGIWLTNDYYQMTKLNQEEILSRIDKQFKLYNNIKMNLYSKIYVLNTKILSQIPYIATSIYVDPNTIKLIKKRILDFLWEGKTPKIKYSVLIGDHYEGGIKLVDIENKIKALQMTWIKRSKNDQPWEKFFKEVNHISWNRIINFNINIEGVVKRIFYKKLLSDWQELYFNETFIDNIFKQPILYNRHIRVGNSIIKSNFDDTDTIGNILNNDIIGDTFIKKLLIQSVKSAIPKRFKDKWKLNQTHQIKSGLVNISNKWKKIEKFSTREIYKELIKDLIEKPTAILNLEKNLEIEIDKPLWQSFFIRVRKYTKNRYFRTNQFKLLHGILNTRKNLVKWKISNDNKCQLCPSNEIENTDHYFLNCDYNKNLLKTLYEKVGDALETKINITDVEYITGLWFNNFSDKNLIAIDKVLLMGRMYLINRRRSRTPVSLDDFTNYIITHLDLENLLTEFRPSRIFNNIAWDRIIKELTEE